MNINLIVAVDAATNGIGYKGQIPWYCKSDMKFFKKVTVGDGNNGIIMGRNTYESIGNVLPGRTNFIVSNTLKELNNDGIIVSSLDEGITKAKEMKLDELYVIGGAKLYSEAMDRDIIDIVYIDYIYNIDNKQIQFDTYFNYYNFNSTEYYYKWKHNNILMSMYHDKYSTEMNDIMIFNNKKDNIVNNVDNQYLKLLNKIKTNGRTKHTRAGETVSIFGENLTFDLREGLPVLTTKKMYMKGCIHELLWFFKGNTNIKYLIDNNTHIWDDDAYRYFRELFKGNDELLKLSKEEFLEQVSAGTTFNIKGFGLNTGTYTFGDLGPVYGKQWTDWDGINQIDELIDKLKNNPDERRLMVFAWNVGKLKDMALPPCHFGSMWYVTEMSDDERIKEYIRIQFEETGNVIDKKDITINYLNEIEFPIQYLSCMWLQRSVDSCLGFPYDLLSYSIFVNLVAQCVNMIPYELKCTLGDTHIYKNQLEGVEKQIKRNPYKFSLPKLKLNKDIKSIYDFKYDDIKIENYESYSTVKYKLSVGL